MGDLFVPEKRNSGVLNSCKLKCTYHQIILWGMQHVIHSVFFPFIIERRVIAQTFLTDFQWYHEQKIYIINYYPPARKLAKWVQTFIQVSTPTPSWLSLTNLICPISQVSTELMLSQSSLTILRAPLKCNNFIGISPIPIKFVSKSHIFKGGLKMYITDQPFPF